MPRFATFEIVPKEHVEAGKQSPFISDGSTVTVTTTTNGIFFERVDDDDIDNATMGGRIRHNSGAPVVSRTSTNAQMKGPILMDYRPGFIPVPGTSGVGAWVAYIPPDTRVEVPCPFGLVGFMNVDSF